VLPIGELDVPADETSPDIFVGSDRISDTPLIHNA
jgi:hypothetical protein